MTAPRIYLAGPDVFLRDALAQAEKKRARCAEAGYVGVFPFDTILDFTGLTQRDKALRIYHADVALMDSCDICLAQMTPFRGPSMDVGTAYEMGYMRAQGKPVLKGGSYYFKDASGVEKSVSAGRVSQIETASSAARGSTPGFINSTGK